MATWNKMRNLPATQEDRLLSEELMKRYGTDDLMEVAERFQKEIGLDPYPIAVQQRQGLEDRGAYGYYDNATGRVVLDKDSAPETRIATLAHELGHAADHTLPMEYGRSTPAKQTHHRGMADFDTDMAKSMSYQRSSEMGVPPEEAILARYPWLRGVNPQSTNRLASPWGNMRDRMNPELWKIDRGVSKKGRPASQTKYDLPEDEDRRSALYQ